MTIKIAEHTDKSHPINPRRAIASLYDIHHRPLIQAFAAFSGGILLASGNAAGAVAVFLAIWLTRFWPPETRRPAVFILVGFALAGAGRFALSSQPAADDISRLIGKGYVTLRGVVSSEVDARSGSELCRIAVHSVTHPEGQPFRVTGFLAARLAFDPSRSPLDFGDEIEVRGRIEPAESERNTGGFEYSAFLAHHQVFATLRVRRASDWYVVEGESNLAGRFQGMASRCRRSLLTTIAAELPRNESSLLAGIMVGSRSGLPKELGDDFIATGTVHVLATAGLHVGALAVALAWFSQLIRVPRRARPFVLIVVLALYTVIAGARPSVVRADAMATIVLVAMILRRVQDAPSALFLAGLSLLIWEPGYLFDMGFQLSFATVGTLIAGMPLAEPYLARLRQPRREGWIAWAAGNVVYFIAAALMVSVAAQLGSAPITAQYFNQISLIAIPANALIVPLIPLVIGLGLVLWLVGAIWPAAGATLASITISPILTATIGVVNAFARAPWAIINVPSPGWTSIGIYYVLLGSFVWWLRNRGKQTPSQL